MTRLKTAGERLDSWKAIAEYLGRDVRTAIRWEKIKRLPIYRVPGGRRQAVFAYSAEIDAWLESKQSQQGDNHDSAVAIVESEFGADGRRVPDAPEVVGLAGSPAKSIPKSQPMPNAKRLGRRMVLSWRSIAGGITTLVLLFTIILIAQHSIFPPKALRFSGVTQITNNGTVKNGLVTDGRSLFFGETRNGKTVISKVAVAGGPITILATQFTNAVPVDISSDGANLLVLASSGTEDERDLWIVPVAGEHPRRVGSVRCHSASWSPDGHFIAYTDQNGVYVVRDTGSGARQLHAFEGVPESIHWLENGRSLVFDVRDSTTLTSSMWQLDLNKEAAHLVSSLKPLNVTLTTNWGGLTGSDSKGRFFAGGQTADGMRIFLLDGGTELQTMHSGWIPVNGVLDAPSYLTVDSKSQTLYAIDYSGMTKNDIRTSREDLILVDNKHGGFRPYLPGVPARELDFSHDGRRIAYIRASDQTLWLANADGTSATQIELRASELELPRWSPDDKSLAVMARMLDSPWRIYLVATEDHSAREASYGTDGQGAPTWSPDGKWIVYANVHCPPANCAIHKIELSTAKQFTVPGSEGLRTARWSPDGRFIVALAPERHQVMIFEESTQRWRKLADSLNGDDLTWSRDSHFVYASRPYGDHPGIVRISVKDGVSETAVDLTTFSKLPGTIETWFTLAPDGSIVILRNLGSSEVFALRYAEQ